MRRNLGNGQRLFIFVIGVAVLYPFLAMAESRQDSKPVKVALLESVFSGQDREQVVKQIQPFADIVQRETGRKATFDIYSFKEMEPAFSRGDIQLVILTGLEYGWVRAKNDQARALLHASIDAGATQTVVVVGQNDKAKELKDLSGANVAFPERVSFLTEYYLKSILGKPAADAFKVQRLDNVDDTLEAVIDGKAQAAVVTKSNIRVFEERKPGRYRRLRVLHESPVFPPATVMYHAKYAEQDALRRFEDALLKANQKPEGNRVLTLYKLKGFEKLPPDFDTKVASMAKQFPEATQ
jgi:ABC-type phosphate/phosphonate transport system substrate-binding protein